MAADGVDYAPEAEKKIEELTALGYAELPIVWQRPI